MIRPCPTEPEPDRPEPDPIAAVRTEPVVLVPDHGLVLLIGASGAGKSTFAARHFRPTEILSSDAFRGLVSDDEADQRATPAAFEVLGRVAAHRLRRGRLSVVDATNLRRADRRGLLKLAQDSHRPAAAIVFDLPLELCQERNFRRAERSVDPATVERHATQLQAALSGADPFAGEGFAAITILRDVAAVDGARVIREPGMAAVRAAETAEHGAAGSTSTNDQAVRRARSGGRPDRRA